MFTSLRFRLWLTYALVVGVVITIAVVAVVAYLVSNPTEDRRELQRLRLVSNLVVRRGQWLKDAAIVNGFTGLGDFDTAATTEHYCGNQQNKDNEDAFVRTFHTKLQHQP